MNLEPIPEILESVYEDDSLVYKDDNSFFYGKKVSKELVRDIKNKEFQVYNGTYRMSSTKNYPIIWLNGRGKRSGKQIFTVENYFPYCYINSKDGKYKMYDRTKVDKILFQSKPYLVGRLRRHCEKSMKEVPKEADIPFIRRFLVDCGDFFKPKEPVIPKICIMDLETNFPIDNKIISFAINGYEDGIYYNSLNDVNEYELVVDLYYHLLSYDIIANWSVDFDISALRVKIEKIEGGLKPLQKGYKLSKDDYIKKLAIDYNLYGINVARKIIDALEKYNFIQVEDNIVVKGNNELLLDLDFLFTPLDLIELSKKMYAREINGRWSLDNVGKQLCGISKIEYKERYPRELEPDKLREYNIRDVEIPKLIDDKLGGIQCHIILAWTLGSMIKDTIITAVVNDIALLKAYHKDGIVLPSRPPYNSRSSDESYKAAEPDARPGVYQDVVAGDLDSAYPRTVMSLNASCETKDPNGKFVAPNGIRFNDGYSTFVEELKRLVKQKKDTKNKLKQLEKDSDEWKTYYYIYFAIKTQVAAFSHGIFGWSNSRMKDLEIADAITSMPREIIELAKEKLDEIEHRWIYAHTDSVYFLSKKDKGKDVLEEINTFIEEYCNERGYNHIPYLDYEGYFPKVYIHSPARNVLVDEDGNWKPTGMNYMRSEVPEPLREIEMELISMKLKQATQSEMISKLREKILNLKDIPASQLGIIKPLTKSISKYGRKGKDGTIVGIPYHISALTNAEEDYGFTVNIGEKFCVIPIITDETEGVRVIKRKRVYMAYPIDEDLPDMYEVDYENYLRSNLWGKVCNLFDKKPKELENIICSEDIKKELNFWEIS